MHYNWVIRLLGYLVIGLLSIVQRPLSRIQCPESFVQRPESFVQCLIQDK